MNLKSLSKISEKIIVIAISIHYVSYLFRLITAFLNPNFYFSGLSEVRSLFDVAGSIQFAFTFITSVLVVVGIIQVIAQRSLSLNKNFRYPVYYFFISRVFSYILNLTHAFHEEEVSPFMREPIETPWYEYLFGTLYYLVFIILVFHFIVRKRESIKSPVEVHKLKRLFNWLLDNLHIMVFLFVLVRSLPRGYVSRDFESLDFSLLLLATSFIYYFLSELLFGQTIGKIPDNSFVQYKGNRLKAIFIRTICRFLPFEPFSFLFMEKGWHDRLSNTSVVIESRSYSEESPEKVEAENKTIEA